MGKVSIRERCLKQEHKHARDWYMEAFFQKVGKYAEMQGSHPQKCSRRNEMMEYRIWGGSLESQLGLMIDNSGNTECIFGRYIIPVFFSKFLSQILIHNCDYALKMRDGKIPRNILENSPHYCAVAIALSIMLHLFPKLLAISQETWHHSFLTGEQHLTEHLRMSKDEENINQEYRCL